MLLYFFFFLKGMCMCIKLFRNGQKLFLLAGYEYGNVIMWDLESKNFCWNLKFHSEPGKYQSIK